MRLPNTRTAVLSSVLVTAWGVIAISMHFGSLLARTNARTQMLSTALSFNAQVTREVQPLQRRIARDSRELQRFNDGRKIAIAGVVDAMVRAAASTGVRLQSVEPQAPIAASTQHSGGERQIVLKIEGRFARALAFEDALTDLAPLLNIDETDFARAQERAKNTVEATVRATLYSFADVLHGKDPVDG